MNATLRRLRDSAAARVICARLVRESLAFFAREVTRPPGIHVYRTRANGLAVAIRHRGVDAATLAEVFHQDWYQPPDEVAEAIGQPRRIVDLGANIGVFGVFAASRWPQAAIIGYEPDPANAAVHERTITANGLGERWSLIRAAAGARGGEVRLVAGRGPSSYLADVGPPADGAIVVEQRDVLAELAACDLAKIDIEGGEWAILADPRFAAAAPGVVLLEYHHNGCSGPHPRPHALRLLETAGLRTRMIWGGEEDLFGMVWAWRA